MNTQEKDFTLLNLIARFLNSNFETTISKTIEEIMETGVSDEEALRFFMAESVDVDTYGKDRNFFNKYYPLAIKKSSPEKYQEDEYYKTISFKNQKHGDSELCYEKYRKYEPFVEDDLTEDFTGVIIPKISFFDREFTYPAVKENGRIWMTVTPNEINTMKEPIQKASGKVLTLGLGLGYFAFSCGMKDNVKSVTVVEKNQDVIDLFNNFILPQFPCKDKIEIIKADAFDFMSSPPKTDFDFVFCDLWHDVSDGAPMLKKLKPYEKNFKRATFSYWIENSIKYYL
ncbi:MAG: hypothetical protein IJW64_05460 [Clostridia bacterium]|nr:hypothetical protein [Clostridia bacterium]